MFIPKMILFEKDALNYEMGRRVYHYFSTNKDVEIIELHQNKIRENIPGVTIQEFYRAGKKTLVVGIKKGKTFQSCKPSAHYQLPLVSGCIGQCQYCYLNTNLGDKPYMRINVNIEEILKQAKTYMEERLPEITIFEGSATSDPIPAEPYSHALLQTIEFFSREEKGRFRFVTKYADVDSLLEADHRNHTEIRFTLNTATVIQEYERGTASYTKRLEACHKILKAKYPMGFIIAPVFIYEKWEQDYHKLLEDLKDQLPEHLPHPLTFEVISHRFTTRAKNIISEVFPDNTLPMKEEDRSYKYGQFGYGKYVYPKDKITMINEFFRSEITAIFPDSEIKYII